VVNFVQKLTNSDLSSNYENDELMSDNKYNDKSGRSSSNDSNDGGTKDNSEKITVKESIKKDIIKVFNLLSTIDSNNTANYSDMIQLCANIGDIKRQKEILSYASDKNILNQIPKDFLFESFLYCYYQNGDVDDGLEEGLEALYNIKQRNDSLSLPSAFPSFLPSSSPSPSPPSSSSPSPSPPSSFSSLSSFLTHNIKNEPYHPDVNVYKMLLQFASILGKPKVRVRVRVGRILLQSNYEYRYDIVTITYNSYSNPNPNP
jgi:hypothetical protein